MIYIIYWTLVNTSGSQFINTPKLKFIVIHESKTSQNNPRKILSHTHIGF